MCLGFEKSVFLGRGGFIMVCHDFFFWGKKWFG